MLVITTAILLLFLISEDASIMQIAVQPRVIEAIKSLPYLILESIFSV